MIYAVKAFIEDPVAQTIDLVACKTMYAGKHIGRDDQVFLFANEQSPRAGLVGCGIVLAAEPLARLPDVMRQTPRVSISVGSIVHPKRPLTRRDLVSFKDYGDGRPQSELNFKFYRQSTDKIVGLTDETAAFLHDFF
jgi:hypothetical protein